MLSNLYSIIDSSTELVEVLKAVELYFNLTRKKKNEYKC